MKNWRPKGDIKNIKLQIKEVKARITEVEAKLEIKIAEIMETNLKTKLKFPTISSRTYSGKYLKASGCTSDRGSLWLISILKVKA